MNITPTDRWIPATTRTPGASSVTVVQSRPSDAPAADTTAPVAADASIPAVAAAAARMEEQARNLGRSLQFRIDESSGRVVVSVRDPETGELIRQIPSESVLKLARDLGSADSGIPSLLIDGQA